jgi:two-component system LytT family response regulator
MVKALIIDDQQMDCDILFEILQLHFKELSVTKHLYTEKSDINSVLKAEKYDLVFLDVELGKKTGFELLDEVGDLDFHLIFVTSHKDMAYKAIKYGAIDFILKPIQLEELKKAVNSVIAKINEKKKNVSPDEIRELVKKEISEFYNTGFKFKEKNKLIIPSKSGIKVLNIDDIVRIEADDVYTEVYLINGKKIVVSKTLKAMSELLTDTFYKVHRSHIINLKYLDEIVSESYSYYAILSDGSKIEVSRSVYSELYNINKQN